MRTWTKKERKAHGENMRRYWKARKGHPKLPPFDNLRNAAMYFWELLVELYEGKAMPLEMLDEKVLLTAIKDAARIKAKERKKI